MKLKYTKAHPSDVQLIIDLFSNFHKLSSDLKDEFYEHAITLTLKPGEHILFQGKICKYMYFIKEGAMMAYSVYNHKKVTTYISIENEFLSSLSGLYGKQPSQEAIVAVEQSTLLGVNTDVLLDWYERFFELNYIIRQIYEEYYRDAQERAYIVRVGNAKERYDYFIKSRGGDVERLPVDCVASFLNMKPDTLIKIKKEVGQQLSDEEVEKIAHQINTEIITKELFKHHSVTLSNFSKEIGIPFKNINEVLNFKYKTTFNDFMNKHRIAYFKNMVKEFQNLQTLTIEGLALKSGFSSRSGFYKIFKKHEGISPKTFVDSLNTKTCL